MSIATAFTFAPDAATAATRWLTALKSERRAAPKTLEAYARDLGQCDGLCRCD
jgi:site-specific recombinase XerD